MVTDVLEVLIGVGAGGVALILGLALAVALRNRPRRGSRQPGGDGHGGPHDEGPNYGGLNLGGPNYGGAYDGDGYDGWAPDGDAPDGDASHGVRPVGAVADAGDPRADGGLWTVAPADRAALLAEADELAAHAELAARQAEQAAAAAEEAQRRYAEAEERRAAIDADYDAARSRYAQALRAAQAGRAAPHTAEDQHRAHEVSSAALAAYRRGELTVDQLRAVFARAGDWDPAQEEREREAERLAAYEGSVRRAYDIAVSAVRVASERLHVAEVAAAATTQEAVDAAVEAQVAEDRTGRYRKRRR